MRESQKTMKQIFEIIGIVSISAFVLILAYIIWQAWNCPESFESEEEMRQLIANKGRE